MARKLQWEPMPELRGKLSKNTKVIYKNYSPTDTDYTSVIENQRDLTVKPLTANEKRARAIFKLACEETARVKTDNDKMALIIQMFGMQIKYKTLNGFLNALHVVKYQGDENADVVTAKITEMFG